MHFWPHVVKTKMCLRGGSFFLVSADIYRESKYIDEKWPKFFSFLHGIVVRVLYCSAIGPWFESHQRHKISLLLLNLMIFFLFLKIYFLTQKTTASQTHFGFTNIGSNMHWFRAIAFYFRNFSNWTLYTSLI